MLSVLRTLLHTFWKAGLGVIELESELSLKMVDIHSVIGYYDDNPYQDMEIPKVTSIIDSLRDRLKIINSPKPMEFSKRVDNKLVEFTVEVEEDTEDSHFVIQVKLNNKIKKIHASFYESLGEYVSGICSSDSDRIMYDSEPEVLYKWDGSSTVFPVKIGAAELGVKYFYKRMSRFDYKRFITRKRRGIREIIRKSLDNDGFYSIEDKIKEALIGLVNSNKKTGGA